MVEITYTTDFDGREVDSTKEELPRTLHGPFETEAEAMEWIHSYPEDTDIDDMRAIVFNRVSN